MTAATHQTAPADQVAEAARVLAPRRGRPRGAVGALSRWLQPLVAKFKRQGESCRNTFLALSVIEGGDEERFEVSAETSDSLLLDLGTSIAGRVVTYEGFRKAWQRAA